MLEFICSIPEEIGWALVGAVAVIAIELGALVISEVVEMVRDRLTDDDEMEEIENEIGVIDCR